MPCTGGVAQKRTAGSRLYLPSRVARLPGPGMPGSMQTRSPVLNSVTAEPTSTTSPAASWPRIIGSLDHERADRAVRVVVHVAAADARRSAARSARRAAPALSSTAMSRSLISSLRSSTSACMSRSLTGPFALSSPCACWRGGCRPAGGAAARSTARPAASNRWQVAGSSLTMILLVHAGRDLAVGLDRPASSPAVELGVEEGLAAEPLDHHHLAGDLAGLGRPQMLGPDAERDGVARP